MKKICSVLFILVHVSLVFATDVTNQAFTYKLYDSASQQFVEQESAIYYQDNALYVKFYNSIGSSAYYYFDPASVQAMRDALEKYYVWARIATNNKEALEKKITSINNLNASIHISKVFPEKTFYPILERSAELVFVFFSQSAQRHQLVIMFGSLTSTSNVALTLEPIYLDKSDVDLFLRLISPQIMREQTYRESKYY